jgi:hypothetical protein
MTPCEAECTSAEPEKNVVIFRDAAPDAGAALPVRLPGRSICNPPAPDIILK